MAQLDNAADSDSEERRFKSCQADQSVLTGERMSAMKKKIITLLSCDIVLAALIYARVYIKKIMLGSIKATSSDASVMNVYVENNWLVMLTMLIVGVIMAVIAVSKTDKLSHLIADIVIIGVPGALMSIWWRVVYSMGGYFVNYTELGAYIGSIMVGVCAYKFVMFVIKKVKKNGNVK